VTDDLNWFADSLPKSPAIDVCEEMRRISLAQQREHHIGPLRLFVKEACENGHFLLDDPGGVFALGF
jgi:hypothetical protein